MKIAVFGLGYVGIVNIACLSKLGHEMWGCDIKSPKVDLVKSGKSPIHEPQVNELLQEGMAKNLIHASNDAAEVIRNSDMALICVGTPSRADGTVNLDYTINTTRGIAQCLKSARKKYTIVYRSTIPPGTVEENFIPILKEELGNDFENVTIAFLPEFLREGSAVKDFFNCSRIVIGCESGEPEILKSVFSYSEQIPLVFTNLRTAEYVKYVDNAFHALKIAFVNEAYSVASSHGVDIEKANSIFLSDTHLNVAKTYLRPGLPFGGSCLPKDLRAINHLAKKKNLKVPLLDSILPSNERLHEELFVRIVASGKKKVTLYGLTFKSGTDDVRESPMLRLAKKLLEENFELRIFDQDINHETLRVDHTEISNHVEIDPTTAFDNSELVVVCKKGFAEFATLVNTQSIVFNFFDMQKFEIPNQQHTLY